MCRISGYFYGVSAFISGCGPSDKTITLFRCGLEGNGIAIIDIPAVSTNYLSIAILIRLCVSIIVKTFRLEVGHKVGISVDNKRIWIIVGNRHRVLCPTIKIVIPIGCGLQRTGVTDDVGTRASDGTAGGWFWRNGDVEFCKRLFCDAVGRPLLDSCCIKLFYNILIIAIGKVDPCCIDGVRNHHFLGNQHSIIGCLAASLRTMGAIDVIKGLLRFRVADTVKLYVIHKEGVASRIYGTIFCIGPGEGMYTSSYIKRI